jgi:putative ABC transport system permease protein
VISRKLAEVLGVRPGEEVICRPLIGERRVTRAAVAAVVDTYIGLAAYADAAYLARLVGEEGASSTVLVRVRPGARTAPLLSALDERPAVVSVERRGRALERIDELLGETIGSSLMVLIAFAGLLGFGGVLNTALVSLNERLREVGTLRVLGYSPLAVLAIFSGESVALSALGVGIGVFAGIGLVHLVSRGYDTELFRLPPVVTASDLGQAAALVLAFILLAQGVVLLVVLKTDWLSVFKVRD